MVKERTDKEEASEGEEKPKETEQPEVKKAVKKGGKKPLASKRSRKLAKFGKTPEDEKESRTVLYVGHLPYGFEETGLQKFFSQFGTITRLKMARSEKVRGKVYRP
jgi:nucleolar protein 15